MGICFCFAMQAQLQRPTPHQLGMWRVNGQMPHIDAWYEAYGITESDPMYLPKEKRVNIW